MDKKYLIITFGCQANSADSERVAGLLEAVGMAAAKNPGEADLIVVNSCSVRRASEDKVYGLANRIKELRSKNQEVKIVLTGCLVGSATNGRKRINLESLRRKTQWVDRYLNINEVASLPDYLLRSDLVDEWAVKAMHHCPDWLPKLSNHEGTAYVNISQGCDNFCTFCVVPYTRGREISRNEKVILEEVNHALRSGFKQVMLLGQNVNSWGLTAEQKALSRQRSGPIPFAALLKKVHALEGVEKIKFLTSNPFDFSADLVETLKLPKIDRYLHLPMQSGDNEVLRRMGRRHRREDYLELVGEIRRAVPEIELGTDIIVGFPGETEEQFLKSVDLVKQVRFNVIFIAMYSPRPGTLSSQLYKDDVPLSEKRRRHAYLTKAWRDSRPT